MLIRAIHAQNFRKYQKLEIDDIPQKGVITIAGLNESGKTSIGEAICFALYGRTFALDEKNLHKIIAWGADIAEVTLKFSDGGANNYTLYRTLSREGELTVKLARDNDKDVILEAKDVVEDALLKILGFDYNAFENSFYLAQHELSTPDPRSDTIKKMAGIGDYASLHSEFVKTNEIKEESINELTPEIADNQSQLDAMQLDETWLPELIDAEQILGVEQKNRALIVDELDENIDAYESNFGTYLGAKKRRGFFGVLSIIFLPVTIILWFLWIGVRFFSERLQGMVSRFEEAPLSLFNVFTENWLLPVALLSTITFLVSLFVKARSNTTMLQLNGAAKSVANTLKEGHTHITSEVENLLPERVMQSMQKYGVQETPVIIPPREQFTNLRQLVDEAPNYKAKPEEVTAAIARMSSAIKKQDGDIEDLGKWISEDINQEKVRSDEAGVLRSTVKKLTTVVSKCQRKIEVNNISIGLLQRAAVSSVALFNKNIADISANTLPKFTKGRYSEVSIAEDLSVRVYSDDKKDYMDFDEISSGTQRQIMLALRMAMSEELAINTGNKEQFIFLDEPFAFFDQERTKSTLKALPDVSEVISQIWVVAQEFPADIEVNKAIICPLESAELLV